MHTNHSISLNLASCGADPDVYIVPGLAMTATEVSKMVQQGLPVSSSNQDHFYFDGYLEKDLVIDNEFERGYDLNQAWDQQCTARENLRRGKRAAKLKAEYDKAMSSVSAE